VWGAGAAPAPHPQRPDDCGLAPGGHRPGGGAGRTSKAQVWDTLGRSTAQPGAPAFRGAVIHDPRSQEPWLLATNLPVPVSDLWALASGAVARGFFREPRTGRSTAETGVGDGACAQGGAGASASDGRSHPPSQQPETAESRLL